MSYLYKSDYSEKEYEESTYDDNIEVRTVPKKQSYTKLVASLVTASLALYGGYNYFKATKSWSFFNSAAGISQATPESDIFGPFIEALDELNLAGNWSKKYTAEPHLAGTNFGLVEWTAAKFKEFGFKPEIDTYDIFVSYPLEHSLKLLDSNHQLVYEASLEEDEIDKDKTTQGSDKIPTFLGYSANGNVTAEYVYVNYGTKEDFEELIRLGVDLKGKIAIVRYGKVFRGLKVKFAQDHGAVGVLIYSDPGDDFGITPENGFEQYPNGPARQDSSVQRGSVQFLGGVGATPGDPTTPGYASKPGAERKDPHKSIGKIPALPISYREVKPILEALNGHGQETESHWHGGLDGIKYNTGPNKNLTLNLYNYQNYTITPLWNVYGEIKGSSDETIVIGNHRDAWIKGGAGDPNSGSASLLELARGLKALQDSGYQFKRTIVLASWDGEEYGLLGSTEFGEYAAERLQKNVVAYFNMDVSVSGKNLNLQSSPVLNHVIKKALKKLPYPGKQGQSLFDHYVETHHGEYIPNLGSGSDYTVFLEHLGIPSIDLGFSGGKNDSIYHYHSNYDSYYWMSHFGDPGFVYHNLAAKLLGLAVLELSEHAVVNFKLNDYAHDLEVYFNETIDLVPKKWLYSKPSEDAWEDFLLNDFTQISFINKITQGEYRTFDFIPFPELIRTTRCKHHRDMLMKDPKNHKDATVEDLIYTTLNDIRKLRDVAKLFDSESEYLQKQWDHSELLHFWQRIRLHFKVLSHNKATIYFERNFLHNEGLFGREWFKHIVFAAGRYTGYAGQTLPGLREAIEDEDFDRYVHWLGILSKTIRRVTARLRLNH